ncbi:hypothetical protein ABC255_02540 [Neobacillus sp. 3P2-tot-E-2]|uniref:hypothetical protein n=1 Tax=Neobacillus sp. 3P2-tot-E-2 TaxID=3132212 RepID=UPI0039A0C8B8
MKKKSRAKLKLSDHAFDRIKNRVKSMGRKEAESFANKEINKSSVTLITESENGSKEIAFIYKGVKYIVKNDTIITVYTLH